MCSARMNARKVDIGSRGLEGWFVFLFCACFVRLVVIKVGGVLGWTVTNQQNIKVALLTLQQVSLAASKVDDG